MSSINYAWFNRHDNMFVLFEDICNIFIHYAKLLLYF